MKIAVHLAEGFEEIEALTVVDILRRAELEVITVSISEEREVKGSHGIPVIADQTFSEMDYENIGMIILPGGPGIKNLEAHDDLKRRIIDFDIDGKYIAAICAAPSIIGKMGFLEDKKATCYPGFEKYLLGAEVVEDSVVVDKNIITSRGVGTAIDFSLKLVEILKGEKLAEELSRKIVYK
jgi:4-methyl-5(b-hydroxyethyl)-thiazole monophosphate biosynthesis